MRWLASTLAAAAVAVEVGQTERVQNINMCAECLFLDSGSEGEESDSEHHLQVKPVMMFCLLSPSCASYLACETTLAS